MDKIDLMIIDDDPMFPLLMEHVWSKFWPDTQIRVYRDAGDALREIVDRDGHPDIILLDLYTLGMDGREFLRAYRGSFTEHPRSLIYTVTASVSRGDADLSDGNGYLAGSYVKPILSGDVQKIVNDYLNANVSGRHV